MTNTKEIKLRLREMHITQAQLARKMRVSASDICRKINNIRPMSLEEAEKIAHALQIPDTAFADYFFAQQFA